MLGLDPPAGPKPLRRGEGPRIHPSSQDPFHEGWMAASSPAVCTHLYRLQLDRKSRSKYESFHATHSTVILRSHAKRGVSKDRHMRSGPSFEARREERRAPQDDGSVVVADVWSSRVEPGQDA